MPSAPKPASPPAMNEKAPGPCQVCGSSVEVKSSSSVYCSNCDCTYFSLEPVLDPDFLPSAPKPASQPTMNENAPGPLPELKPCRLCNAIPELVSYGPVDDQGIAYCCPNKHFRTIYFASPEEAAAAWNDGALVFLGRSGVSTLGHRL